ncbi:hypothetical protein DL93DRAFT_2152867 [Clavulina sp. PMI_390]|nr:hypothetical protein DL93DRAFT_2152867 [Clavulina sp. PMI_390]
MQSRGKNTKPKDLFRYESIRKRGEARPPRPTPKALIAPSANITHLPPELLSHILHLGLPNFESEWRFTLAKTIIPTRKYLLKVLLVCRLWNEVAISTPILWRFCYWGALDWHRSDEGCIAPFYAYLNRSKECPIWVFLDGVDPTEEAGSERAWAQRSSDLGQALVGHCPRIYALAVTRPAARTWEDQAPLSSLRHFWISPEEFEAAYLPTIPHVENISIHDDAESQGSLPASGYITASSTVKRLELFSSDYAIWNQFIRHCPSLEHLTLVKCIIHNIDPVPPTVHSILFRGDRAEFNHSAALFAHCVRSLHLILQGPTITTPTDAEIVGPLPILPFLTSLHLQFFAQDWLAFEELLENAPALQVIKVSAGPRALNATNFLTLPLWLRQRGPGEEPTNNTDSTLNGDGPRLVCAPLLQHITVLGFCYSTEAEKVLSLPDAAHRLFHGRPMLEKIEILCDQHRIPPVAWHQAVLRAHPLGKLDLREEPYDIGRAKLKEWALSVATYHERKSPGFKAMVE